MRIFSLVGLGAILGIVFLPIAAGGALVMDDPECVREIQEDDAIWDDWWHGPLDDEPPTSGPDCDGWGGTGNGCEWMWESERVPDSEYYMGHSDYSKGTLPHIQDQLAMSSCSEASGGEGGGGGGPN